MESSKTMTIEVSKLMKSMLNSTNEVFNNTIELLKAMEASKIGFLIFAHESSTVKFIKYGISPI